MKFNFIKKVKNSGQALVETALFLPVFMVIIAGVVEVSQLTVTQNRISDSARAATRFGSNGGEDEGMVTVIFNSITQTMQVSNERWDVWVVRGTVNSAGDDFQTWSLNHAYGFSNTVEAINFNEGQLQRDILEELAFDHNGNSLGSDQLSRLEIVGTYVIHDVNSLLGLDGFPMLEGLHSIESLNVMRVSSTVEQSDGCSAFPLAIHDGVRSANPPGQGSTPYPDFVNFDYPSSNHPTYGSFVTHVEDIPLSAADEGYVYLLTEGFNAGEFGWLNWNQGRPPTPDVLSQSLTWPGNSLDFSNHGDTQTNAAASAYPHIVRGYVEPGDATDISLHIGDWVASNQSDVNTAAVQTQLQQTIGLDRTIRLIVWDSTDVAFGFYRIGGFAVFKMLGYHISSGAGNSWVLLEFIRWDDSCGQVIDTP